MKTQTWLVEVRVKLEDGASPNSLLDVLAQNLYPDLGEEIVDYYFTEVQE
jgi:hypothetical protein